MHIPFRVGCGFFVFWGKFVRTTFDGLWSTVIALSRPVITYISAVMIMELVPIDLVCFQMDC